MKKINNLIIVIVIVIVLFIGTIFVLINRNTGELPQTGHFQIIDEIDQIILNQNIEDMENKIMPEALEFYNSEVLKLENLISITNDEMIRRDYFNDIAKYLNNLGRYEEAYKYYLMSLDISYIQRLTWINLADLLVKMKAYKSAEVAYLKANDINAFAEENYIKLAKLYILLNYNIDDIIEIYDKGISIMQKPKLILDEKAKFLEANDMLEDAINTYEKLLDVIDNKEWVQSKIDKLNLEI